MTDEPPYYHYTDLDTVPREALQQANANAAKIAAELEARLDNLSAIADKMAAGMAAMQAEGKRLDGALRTLARYHTRDDPSFKFVIETGGPSSFHQDYVEAWRTVRRYLGLPS